MKETGFIPLPMPWTKKEWKNLRLDDSKSQEKLARFSDAWNQDLFNSDRVKGYGEFAKGLCVLDNVPKEKWKYVCDEVFEQVSISGNDARLNRDALLRLFQMSWDAAKSHVMPSAATCFEVLTFVHEFSGMVQGVLRLDNDKELNTWRRKIEQMSMLMMILAVNVHFGLAAWETKDT